MIQERAERNANEWRGGLRRGVWREVQTERDRMTGSEKWREREREIGGCIATEQERAPVKVRLN